MAALEPPIPFKIAEKAFRILHKQQVTPTGSGYIQTIDRTLPRWFCELQTPPMDRYGLAYAAFLSFLDQLEGAANTFLCYDPTRPKPLYYIRFGGTPPATTITDMEYDTSRIKLSGLAVGRLTVGDYISYYYGDGPIWRLYRCIGDLDSDGWVYVKPRPIEHSGLPITARLVKPVGEFKMLGDYEEIDSVQSQPSFKFSGVQFINRNES